MLMAILLVGAVALGWLLACGGLAPRGAGRSHGLDRRLRWVERHPGEVNTGDIERVLLRQGLSLADVRLVTNRAFSLGIKPFTMWMWIQAYGARELAVAVAGDLPHDELLEHLGEGTLPDFHELEVFAALNGLEAATIDAGRHREVPLAASTPPRSRSAARSTTSRSTSPAPGRPGCGPRSGPPTRRPPRRAGSRPAGTRSSTTSPPEPTAGSERPDHPRGVADRDHVRRQVAGHHRAAPTTVLSPMVTPASTIAPPPSQTLSPIVIGGRGLPLLAPGLRHRSGASGSAAGRWGRSGRPRRS